MRAFLGLMIAVLVHPADDATEVRIVRKSDVYSVAELKRAVEAFRLACPRLRLEWWPEFTDILVETSEEYADHRLALGWATNIHLALRVPDHPVGIPGVIDEIGVIAGHVLDYDFGGAEPGLLASKRVSQYGRPMPVHQSGDDVFKSVPEFSFLQ